MSDEFARINELEEATNAEVNRDWLIEIDKEEDSEDLESKCYSIGSLFDKIVASNDDFGTVKIGTESTIRNESAEDNENMLPASILRKLFNKTYNFNNNDIYYDSSGTLDIIDWNTAAVGNMLFHNGNFTFKKIEDVTTYMFTFKNVSPNPKYIELYPTQCIVVEPHGDDAIPNIFANVPAYMTGIEIYGEKYTRLVLQLGNIDIPNNFNMEYVVNGVYFRDR